MSETSTKWQHLATNPKSVYRQLFLKGTRIRAEVIYGMTVDGSEPMTPEKVAEEMNLPIEAVREAIAYCESNPPEVSQDHRNEERLRIAAGMADPNYQGTPKVLSAEELVRLYRP